MRRLPLSRRILLVLLLCSKNSWSIVIVEPDVENEALQETASRLRAELLADGVPVRSLPARPETPSDEPLVEFQGEQILVSLPGAEPGEPASVVHLSVPEVEAAKKPAVLALRASELLVAWQQHRDEPKTNDLPLPSPAEPVPTVAPLSPDPPPRHALFLQLGAGGSASWGAPLTMGVSGSVGMRFPVGLSVGLTGWGDVMGTSFETGSSSATMHLHLLMLEPRWLVPLNKRWEFRLGPSLGGAFLFGRGEANDSERDFQESRVSLNVGAASGIYFRAQSMAVGLDGRGTVALPTPVLLVEEERYPIATPLLQLGVVVEATL